MRREISFEDQEWFLHTHGQKFADAQFAELDDKPCSSSEDFLLNAGTLLLALSPILIVIGFKVF